MTMTRRTGLAGGLLALLMAAGLGTARGQETKHGLDIYFIDVQGGAATLVVTPERETVLIDTGWPGFDDRDPKRIVHVLKDVAGCERIDHLVTTHWHMDHFGGVEGLSKLVEIGQFWDRGLPEDKLEGLDFPDGPKPDDPLGVAYRKASAGKRKVLRAGDRLPLKSVEAVVLASGQQLISCADCATDNKAACDEVPDKPEDKSDNARSIVLRFRSGAFDFFDGGDLTWNVEKQLVCPEDRVGKVDLYQVTHHGMDISNHPTLVKTVAPTVAVMNNGPRKGGSAATVRLLKGTPSVEALYALHKNQATGPADNADSELTANSDPAGGQFVQANVAGDGKTFRVRIGADGKAREYPVR